MSLLDGWMACPRCRADLVPERGAVRCPACGFVAYANPAPTASALCVDEQGRVLLARRAREPFKGRWDLPGGFVDEWEDPLDALRRELREETSLEIEPEEFLGAFADEYRDGDRTLGTLNLFWRARPLRGRPQPADDVHELGWFGREELPPREELAFVCVPAVLELWRRSPL